jgi:hypothetical protein
VHSYNLLEQKLEIWYNNTKDSKTISKPKLIEQCQTHNYTVDNNYDHRTRISEVEPESTVVGLEACNLVKVIPYYMGP